MRYQRTTGFWLTGVIAAVSLGLVALPSPNTAMADPSTTQTTHVDCSSSASGDGSIDHPVNGVDKLDKAFGPGKRVLFKRGTTCRGTVVVNASGTNHARTLIGAYGQGKAPILDAQGSATNQRSVIEVDDRSHITIQDLTVRNGWFSNISVETHNGHVMEGITVQRVAVEENAWKGGPNKVTDNFWVMGVGGVIVMPCSARSAIKDVVIDQVEASRQHYAGVQVGYHQLHPWSDYEKGIKRDGYMVPTCFDQESKPYPHVSPVTGIQNAVISNSSLHDNDAMGAGIFGATDVLLRNNDLYRNGSGIGNPGNTMNGTGAWWDTTRHVTAEWNNAWGNRVGYRGQDGTGLDADRNTKNSIIQNNYLHDNGGYGASVIAAYGDASATIRHNLMVDNGTHDPDRSSDIMISSYSSPTEDGRSVTGQVSGLWIYGNTIHRDQGKGNAPGIRLQSRYRPNTAISIVNNIVNRPGRGGIYSFQPTDAAEVDMVRGNLVSTDGTFARTQDVEGRPTFLSTARDNMNWPKGDSFRLAATSLGARNAVGYDNATLPGKAPTARGATDLWGTTIPEKSGFAIGADVAPGKAASATPRSTPLAPRPVSPEPTVQAPQLPWRNTIPEYELPSQYVSTIMRAPKTDRQYLAHPDTIKTRSGRLVTTFAKGHGKGPIIMMISQDRGRTWVEKKNTPASWAGSQETPTLFTLDMPDGRERLLLVSANPGWGTDLAGHRHGFNTSYSDDDGDTWSEYKHFLTKRDHGNVDNDAIVAMASLVQLRDSQGKPLPRWMGIYHDHEYVNYKTILSFDGGVETWSDPVPLLAQHREIEREYQMCEIGMFRSPDGKHIVGLARSQSHRHRATLIQSGDEGQTWSKPKELPGSLAGERHKPVYDPITGRVVVSMREIRYDLNGNGTHDGAKDWRAGNWVAWVGSYDELINQKEGQYRILLSHDWSQSIYGGDTGYSGVVTFPDGTFLMTSYGHWDEAFSRSWVDPATHHYKVTTDLSYIRQAKFTLRDFERANGIAPQPKPSVKPTVAPTAAVTPTHPVTAAPFANESRLVSESDAPVTGPAPKVGVPRPGLPVAAYEVVAP